MATTMSICFGGTQNIPPCVAANLFPEPEISEEHLLISFGDFEDEFILPHLHLLPESRLSLEKKGIPVSTIKKIHRHFVLMQGGPTFIDGKSFVLTKDRKYVVLCPLHNGSYKREKLVLKVSELKEGIIHPLARGTALVGSQPLPRKKRFPIPSKEAEMEAAIYNTFKKGCGSGIVETEECSIVPYSADGTVKKMILVQEYYPQTLLEFARETWGKAEIRFLSIMRSVLQGLQTLEKKGITIRDIKSDNIYIKGGLGVLADFTLAVPWQETRELVSFPREAYEEIRIFHLALGHEPPELARSLPQELLENVLRNLKKIDVWMTGVTLLRPFFPYLMKEPGAKNFHQMVDKCFLLDSFSAPLNPVTGKKCNIWKAIGENVKAMTEDFPRPPENTYSFLLWNMLRFRPEDRLSPSELLGLEERITTAKTLL